MDKHEIDRLISRYNNEEATSAERAELERLLEAGVVSLDDVEVLRTLQSRISRMEVAGPSPAADDRFYKMLSAEKRADRRVDWKRFFSWPEKVANLRLASVMLVVGLVVGYLLRTPLMPANDKQINALSQQVSDLQEMMMLSLLEKGSATDRLKAVNLAEDMNDASRKVTNALLRTLNEDENINVRLAALEALKPYAADSNVRGALIRSIARQDSPLVQVALAELMVALREKSSVKEFQKIIESDKTPAEIKRQISESIKILI
ncbi:MAG TPA: HEAT repeat domain-containing protein [Chryseosolibacter sp.]